MSEVLRSEYNTFPEVTATLTFPDEIFIVDSTIRSLQSGISGSRHTARDLVEIGMALDDLGVRELIVNISWKDGLAVCEGLAQENLKAKVVGTFRARHPLWERWMEDSLRAGADEICFESAPDSNYLRRAADLVHQQGKTVSHAFAEFYTHKEVLDLVRAGVTFGYRSQSFHDSFFRFGITPEAIKFFIRSIKTAAPQCPPLYVHFSNFYGQATMTAVAALTAGASAADVCMNGTGHHCGHISLAEIVMVLEGLYGVKTGIKLSKLREVSLLVRDRTGIPLSISAPVVGDFSFMLDGAYWAVEANVPYEERVHAIFPFHPDFVGGEERVVWSEKTLTPQSVEQKLIAMRLPYKEEHIRQIVNQLEQSLRTKANYPNWISDKDFESLCRKALASVPLGGS